jgi:hypothetical protein
MPNPVTEKDRAMITVMSGLQFKMPLMRKMLDYRYSKGEIRHQIRESNKPILSLKEEAARRGKELFPNGLPDSYFL